MGRWTLQTPECALGAEMHGRLRSACLRLWWQATLSPTANAPKLSDRDGPIVASSCDGVAFVGRGSRSSRLRSATREASRHAADTTLAMIRMSRDG
jgi:hypothetical protein